jgi:hypothetical protein
MFEFFYIKIQFVWEFGITDFKVVFCLIFYGLSHNVSLVEMVNYRPLTGRQIKNEQFRIIIAFKLKNNINGFKTIHKLSFCGKFIVLGSMQIVCR